LLAGMARERQAQQDPTIRAERLVARWSKLEEEHGKLRRWQQREGRDRCRPDFQRLVDSQRANPRYRSRRPRALTVEADNRQSSGLFSTRSARFKGAHVLQRKEQDGNARSDFGKDPA
jgi:hypothetical protein